MVRLESRSGFFDFFFTASATRARKSSWLLISIASKGCVLFRLQVPHNDSAVVRELPAFKIGGCGIKKRAQAGTGDIAKDAGGVRVIAVGRCFGRRVGRRERRRSLEACGVHSRRDDRSHYWWQMR